MSHLPARSALTAVTLGLLTAVAGGPAAAAPRSAAGYADPACTPYAAISGVPGLSVVYFYRQFRADSGTPRASCTARVPVLGQAGVFAGRVRITAEARGSATLPAGTAATVTVTTRLGAGPLTTARRPLRPGAATWTAAVTGTHQLAAGARPQLSIWVTLAVTGAARLAASEISAVGAKG